MLYGIASVVEEITMADNPFRYVAEKLGDSVRQEIEEKSHVRH